MFVTKAYLVTSSFSRAYIYVFVDTGINAWKNMVHGGSHQIFRLRIILESRAVGSAAGARRSRVSCWRLGADHDTYDVRVHDHAGLVAEPPGRDRDHETDRE